jgi:outer membrane protein
VQVNAGAQYVHGTDTVAALTGFTPAFGVSARMPLFSGGLIAAQVRQAQARQSEALENISWVERSVHEAATSAFALLRTSQSLIRSAEAQIRANALAAEGVRQENLVGSRDILDVLNAEQELLNAQVSLVEAQRDRQVSAYQLFMVTGELEQVLDGAPIGRYDAEANARRVRGKGWQEFSHDPDPRQNRARDQAPAMIGPRE